VLICKSNPASSTIDCNTSDICRWSDVFVAIRVTFSGSFTPACASSAFAFARSRGGGSTGSCIGESGGMPWMVGVNIPL